MANLSLYITRNTQNVEIPCKTTRKSPCKSPAKLRVNLPTSTPTCVNLHFFTTFSHLSHHLSHHPTTPILQLIFPLFHRPYYYNYLLFK